MPRSAVEKALQFAKLYTSCFKEQQRTCYETRAPGAPFGAVQPRVPSWSAAGEGRGAGRVWGAAGGRWDRAVQPLPPPPLWTSRPPPALRVRRRSFQAQRAAKAPGGRGLSASPLGACWGRPPVRSAPFPQVRPNLLPLAAANLPGRSRR